VAAFHDDVYRIAEEDLSVDLEPVLSFFKSHHKTLDFEELRVKNESPMYVNQICRKIT
jgi:hypothetical protein